jgi:hypothetical protein
VLLAQLQVVDINVAKASTDSLSFPYNKSDCLLIIAEDLPRLAELHIDVTKQSAERHALFSYVREG